jgi:hypothetical protein
MVELHLRMQSGAFRRLRWPQKVRRLGRVRHQVEAARQDAANLDDLVPVVPQGGLRDRRGLADVVRVDAVEVLGIRLIPRRRDAAHEVWHQAP